VTASNARVYRGPALASPVPDLTLPRFIRRQARQWSDAVALVEAASGREIRYAELDRMIGRVAAGLAARGLHPGATLLMCAPNLPEWPLIALGALAAGAVVSGANPQAPIEDLAHQMRDAGARFVCTVPPLLATVREAAAQTGCERIVLIGGEADGTIGLASLLACTDAEPEPPNDPDAVAALPYSSGTTGLAKGVVLTHRTIVANICQYNQAIGNRPPGVGLAFLPMFHIYGFTIVTLCALVRGQTLVTVPRFEPESFLRAIATYRVTRLAVVPPVLHFLATHPLVDRYDLSSLEAVGCGAAPLGAALERQASERLKCPVLQGFGMTESSGAVFTSDLDALRSGTSGRLLPGTEARLIDPASGTDVSPGEAGELWFRGPQAFKGYLHQSAASAATLTPDGWVRTGDVGRIDADGYLTITDRLKELIKVKGFQVAPAELEALLVTHPAVADVTVIGRPDERAGEVPVAYVVPRGAFDAEAIKAWVAERVVAYKQLADVVACAAIPKTPAGKILRRVVRETDARRAENPPA
jgi:acyl-CoA synthetase (AMP-forming)/AMP-acid ligase II